jgi:hypothetical protein
MAVKDKQPPAALVGDSAVYLHNKEALRVHLRANRAISADEQHHAAYLPAVLVPGRETIRILTGRPSLWVDSHPPLARIASRR